MDRQHRPATRRPIPAGDKPPKEERRVRSVTIRTGDDLEYRVARLFARMGYFVRRSRLIYTVAALDTATDLDVFAIRYNTPFRREVQIAECKDHAGTGPLDRVFWLTGVKHYVRAQHATLVRRSTKWNIKDFARQAGIEILDFPITEQLEAKLHIDAGYWPGATDKAFFALHQSQWNGALRRSPRLVELYETLSGEVRFQDPFGAINYLIYNLRALTRALEDRRPEEKPFLRYLAAESIVFLMLFFLRIAETTFDLAETDRAGLVHKGLTFGNVDVDLTKRIMRNAHRITSEMVKHYTGQEIEVDESFFTLPTPTDEPRVQEIISIITGAPTASSGLVPVLDHILTEVYVKERPVGTWLDGVFGSDVVEQSRRLLGQIGLILREIDAVPKSMLEVLNNTHPGPAPGDRSSVRFDPPEKMNLSEPVEISLFKREEPATTTYGGDPPLADDSGSESR